MAMETIVYIILAVTVLTVLLIFFTSQAGPAQNTLELLNQQRDGCIAYAQQDPSCGNEGFPSAGKLEKACKSLKQFNECDSGSTSSCFKACCRTFCRVI
jgi:hypothetical protein